MVFFNQTNNDSNVGGRMGGKKIWQKTHISVSLEVYLSPLYEDCLKAREKRRRK